MERHTSQVWLRPTHRCQCSLVSTDAHNGISSSHIVNFVRYQRLYFRNLNHPIVRSSVTTRRQENRAQNSLVPRSGRDKDDDRDAPAAPQSHIFDGLHVTTETAAFQLCDIHDPMLKEMIEDKSGLRDVCNVSTCTCRVLLEPANENGDRSEMDGTPRMRWSRSNRYCAINSSRSWTDTAQQMRSAEHF